ncbi:MAG: hypothetical protein ACLP8V_07325 [Thermoplasmata archaeon]
MSSAGEDDFLLFVAGEPDSGVDSLQKTKSTVVGRFVDAALPFGGRMPISRTSNPPGAIAPGLGEAPPSESVDRPWHLPRQQLRCVDMVLRIAGRERRRVTVVDTNRATAPQGLVDRWVGPNDVLPLLVGPDGARLEGIEEFVPQKVRQFIVGRQAPAHRISRRGDSR